MLLHIPDGFRGIVQKESPGRFLIQNFKSIIGQNVYLFPGPSGKRSRFPMEDVALTICPGCQTVLFGKNIIQQTFLEFGIEKSF